MEALGFWMGVLGLALTFFSVRREFARWRLETDIKQQNLISLAAFNARDPAVAPSFDIQKYQIDAFWRDDRERSRVLAIVSGKGGVGKSVIAIALTEYYSIQKKVLLVDFDLHNRGLTSRLGQRRGGSGSSLWSLLTRFQDKVIPTLRSDLMGESGSVDLQKLDRGKLKNYRDRFTYDEIGQLVDLKCSPLFVQQSAGSRSVVDNCFFLPSRRLDETFLASEISRLDIPEVAIFVKCLATLAARALKVDVVILDCHGAHDLFMAGAIVASEDLVVVSRPEISAFEGTMELVSLSKKLVSAKNCSPEQEFLVMNEVRSGDGEVCDVLVEKIKYDKKAVIKIPHDESIMAAQRDVATPSYHKIDCIWSAVRHIADKKPEGNKSSSPPADLASEGYSATASSAVLAPGAVIRQKVE